MPLRVVGHARAERIREGGHRHDRGHPVAVEPALELGDVHPVLRVAGDLEDAQAERLERLQGPVVRGRLDRHDVARLRDREEAEVDTLRRPRRHDDVVLGERSTPGERSLGDDVAELLRAGWHLVADGVVGEAPRGDGHRAGEGAGGKESWLRRRLGELDEAGIAREVVDARDERAHRDRRRDGGGRGAGGPGRRRSRPGAHEVTRARPRLDEPQHLELRDRLQHGGHRRALVLREPAHRREPLAGGERPLLDGSRVTPRDLLVPRDSCGGVRRRGCGRDGHP